MMTSYLSAYAPSHLYSGTPSYYQSYSRDNSYTDYESYSMASYAAYTNEYAAYNNEYAAYN